MRNTPSVRSSDDPPSWTTRAHISEKLKKKSKLASQHSKQLYNELIKEKQKTKLWLTESKGYLEAEGMEKTYKFTQEAIKEQLDLVNRAKIFDLDLTKFGPYCIDYTENGRYLLLGGRRGHLATMDWKKGKLMSEIHVKETVRDVSWLHNETFYAAAQREYVHIYDRSGIELHVLRKHHRAQQLQFLPYHFLLATIGDSGILRYQDVSIGQLMYEQSTHRGTTNVMTTNPSNAIVHCGHTNGTVTLWSPNVPKPLVEVLCHRTGPVTACGVYGSYMLTASASTQGAGVVSVWDMRHMYNHVHTYTLPKRVSCLSVSQQGLWACNQGGTVHVYTSVSSSSKSSLYMKHKTNDDVLRDLHFVPFDDVLGVGRTQGFSSLVIPGSGEPNFDTLEANPYETSHQRREREVHRLLDKVPIDTIVLDPYIIGQCVSRQHPTPSQMPLEAPSVSTTASIHHDEDEWENPEAVLADLEKDSEDTPNDVSNSSSGQKTKQVDQKLKRLRAKRREQLKQRRLRRLLGVPKATMVEAQRQATASVVIKQQRNGTKHDKPSKVKTVLDRFRH